MKNGYIIDVIEKVKVKTQIEELKISWSEYIENRKSKKIKRFRGIVDKTIS